MGHAVTLESGKDMLTNHSFPCEGWVFRLLFVAELAASRLLVRQLDNDLIVDYSLVSLSLKSLGKNT